MHSNLDYETSYKKMSEDNDREKEALEWCEAAFMDLVISQSVIPVCS